MMTIPPTATPTPMPAFAPVLSPPLLACGAAIPVPVPVADGLAEPVAVVAAARDEVDVVAVAVAAAALPIELVAERPQVWAAAATLCKMENSALWPTGPQSGESWQYTDMWQEWLK